MGKEVPGLFITGTDTGVGKTHVATIIVRQLRNSGYHVGVYKPVASGCEKIRGRLVSEDAFKLWDAAGRPGPIARVCPQAFAAPLAPHLAAALEGKKVDWALAVRGFEYWCRRSDIIIVEGAGGLLSPVTEEHYVADLAESINLPLVVVTKNVLGTINQTLQTLMAAANFGQGLPVAGIVVNEPLDPASDLSSHYNVEELQKRCGVPILAHVRWKATESDRQVDWFKLARQHQISKSKCLGTPGGVSLREGSKKIPLP